MINKQLSLVLVTFVICVSVFAHAGDGKVPGKPFQNLQQQIDILNQQVADLQQSVDIGQSTDFNYKEVIVASGQSTFICVNAPKGKDVVGGGGLFENPSSPFALTMLNSYPGDGECTTFEYSFSWDSWCVYWRNDTDNTWTGTIYAFIISVGEEYTGPYYGCN